MFSRHPRHCTVEQYVPTRKNVFVGRCGRSLQGSLGQLLRRGDYRDSPARASLPMGFLERIMLLGNPCQMQHEGLVYHFVQNLRKPTNYPVHKTQIIRDCIFKPEISPSTNCRRMTSVRFSPGHHFRFDEIVLMNTVPSYTISSSSNSIASSSRSCNR